MLTAITIIYSLFTIGIFLLVISAIVNSNRNRKGMQQGFSNAIPIVFIVLLVSGLFISGSVGFPSSIVGVLLIMLITFVCILFLNQVYGQLTNHSPHVLHTIVYIFSLLSIAGTGLGFIMDSVDIVYFFEDILGLVIADGFIVVGFVLCMFILNKILGTTKNHNSQKFHAKVSKDKIQHYREAGLNDEEISYLRDQLAQLRENIHSLETQMNATAKLRAIDVRHNTIEISKQFFQDIVKEPKRFGEAGDVIYRIIPSLVDLTEKYNEINDHIAKTKQTYIILEKSAQTIDELAKRLTDEYIDFHKATYQDLDDEINLANRNLNKTQKWEESNDSVDDILNEWNNKDNYSEKE